MAENLKGNIVTGLAAGVGATLLAPIILPILANIIKPLTKGTIKAGILFYEKGLESFAELSETVEDLVAEAKLEMEAEAAPGAAVAAQTSGASDTAQLRPRYRRPRQARLCIPANTRPQQLRPSPSRRAELPKARLPRQIPSLVKPVMLPKLHLSPRLPDGPSCTGGTYPAGQGNASK